MIDAEDARKIAEGRSTCKNIYFTLEQAIRKKCRII